MAPVKGLRVYGSTRTILDDDGVTRVRCVKQREWLSPEGCDSCAAVGRNYAGGTRCWDCVQSCSVVSLRWLEDKYPRGARVRSCSRCGREHMDFSVDGVDCGCPYTDCLYKIKDSLLSSMCLWGVM